MQMPHPLQYLASMTIIAFCSQLRKMQGSCTTPTQTNHAAKIAENAEKQPEQKRESKKQPAIIISVVRYASANSALSSSDIFVITASSTENDSVVAAKWRGGHRTSES